jgi:dTDP-4-amino-4,6-dideoxygalactose transaminase
VALAPTRLSVYPALSPARLLRPPARRLPFPLDEPDSRLYLEARQGLWWALKGLGIGEGDEVLAPAYHHGSEIEVLVRSGARCRFYDVRGTFEPDEAELEPLLGPRVRALYLIHFLGFPQDSARWRRWCDERGLLLIEDGAQAWLSARNGRLAGADADLALFCLYKAFAVPDGGAVIARAIAGPPPDDGWPGAQRLAVLLANWARQRSRVAASVLSGRAQGHEQDERPEVDFALTAVDERPTRVTSALLRWVVDERAPARRRAHFAHLAERLDHLRSPTFATLPDGASPLAFPIEVGDKRAVVDRLAREGIVDTRMWMVAHPALDAAAYPGAAALRERLVGLPVHQGLRRRDVERVAAVALAVCG